MPEKAKIQYIPVKMYRTADRLMVAAPLPGLQPEDITIEVSEDGHMVIQGEVRGLLKDVKELLLDEWSVGGYYRELYLPLSVDAEHANVTYGNGVLVVTLPISEQTVPALMVFDQMEAEQGVHAGNAGHPPDGAVEE